MIKSKKYYLARYYIDKSYYIQLLGGKCVICNSTENLEFDHVNPKDKSFTISSKLRVLSKKKILEELKKCQLLCKNCHKIKTLKDLGQTASKNNHGSRTCYVHQKCRCILCKKANSEACKLYKRKLRGVRSMVGRLACTE